MLDGRRFPPAEGPNKKVAKKDAAATTLKILLRELEGAGGDEEEEPSIEGVEDSTTDLADDMIVCLFYSFQCQSCLKPNYLISYNRFDIIFCL